ncbi:MAG: hypothetical protein HQM08_24300 [Candidatus Riflebacteria bacterium]|nr:hypothetical protein [Candidatus Riflebacteria bacterium]
MNLAEQIETLKSVCGEALIIKTLKKLGQIELQKYLALLCQTNDELKPFEKKFSLKNKTAWKKFQNGQLDDKPENMEWVSIYQNKLLLQEKISRLEKLPIHD